MSEGTYPIACIIFFVALLPAGILVGYVTDKLEELGL